MKKLLTATCFITLALTASLGCGSATKVESPREKLMKWQMGVWISGSTYTIWTPKHYFVLSLSGDSSNANIYYGCSQVSYHDKGITRKQVQRFRQYPGGEHTIFSENTFTPENTETTYIPDTTLFDTTHCVIKDGVIYDAIVEVTDSTILLATCNGDHEMIFSNGKSIYMPADGGAFPSYRIEEFH